MSSCLDLWVNNIHMRTNSYRKEFAPLGANLFLYELISIKKGGKMKMAELFFLVVYPFTI